MAEIDQVRKAQAGDRDAREALARAWLKRAYGVAFAVTGRRIEAEEAVQDAFLRAFRSIERLRDRGRFGPWLMQITRNAARDRIRRRPRPTATLIDEPVDPVSETPDGLAPGWEVLSSEERMVCWLHVCNDLTFREIAELLDLSNSRIYRIYRKGIDTLRNEVLATTNEAAK